ncbi:MAG: hypothetical protein VB934_12505, partial [Polyangiaceae bacterium]
MSFSIFQRFVFALAMTATCWCPSASAAPGTPANGTAVLESAQRFDAGLRAMLTGNYSSACPDLAISYHLDPRPGSLFTLAECFAKWQREAIAIAHYKRFLTVVRNFDGMERQRQTERAAVARSQIAELEKKLGRASNAAPDSDEGKVPVAGVAPLATAAESSPEPEPLTPPDVTAGHGSSPSTTWRYASYGVGALGVVALITGTGAGIAALNESKTVDAACIDQRCTPAGKEAADRAKTLGTWSTASFVVGFGAVASSIGLLVFEPTAADDSKDTANSTVAIQPCHTVG